MADHLDTAFRAAASALGDVVGPAVDPTNPLAREQLQLVIAWLDFARGRLPYLHHRDRFELSAHADMGDALLQALNGSLNGSLQASVSIARATLSDPAAGATAFSTATAGLQDEISITAQRAAELPDDTRQRIEQSIVSHSKRILDAQRVWFLPQSVEPEPEKMPSLHEALRLVAD